jgi:outer membrane protein assembly factor BamE
MQHTHTGAGDFKAGFFEFLLVQKALLNLGFVPKAVRSMVPSFQIITMGFINMPKKVVLIWVCCLSLVLFSGCHFPPRIYRINIEQGNIFDQKQVNQLKIGMSKSEVQSVLGTCLLPHHMRADRWDYYYSFVSGETGKKKEKHLELHFKNDKLSAIYV